MPMVNSAMWLVHLYLAMAGSEGGRHLLRHYGERLLQNRLLSFLRPTNEWRRGRLVKAATIASRIACDVLTDPQRPQAVKEALRGLMLTYANVGKRLHWREQYGVAPANVVVDFTNRCNLNCFGCYANSYRKGDDLSFEVVDRIVSEVEQNFGVHFVTLTGGEPFLRWDDMAELARAHDDTVFMVYTNGALISERVVAGLAEIGSIFPAISIEGWEEETDARRGKGHYQKIHRVMEALRQAGVVFGVSITATSHNAHVLSDDDFIRHWIDEGTLFAWIFHYIPIGRTPDLVLMLRPDQRSRLAEKVNLWRDLEWPILTFDFWNDGALVFTEGQGACIAGGRRYLHIDGKGDIKPCVFAPVAAANIHEVYGGESPFGSLTDVILHSPVFTTFRAVQEEIKDPTSPCPMIDHPRLGREVYRAQGAYDVKSTPEEGFFKGRVADFLDERSAEWRGREAREPYLYGGPYEQHL